MKKTIMEKLGLEPVQRLNPTICRKRAKFLRQRIEQKKVSPSLLAHARYYANWYAWRADHTPKRREA